MEKKQIFIIILFILLFGSLGFILSRRISSKTEEIVTPSPTPSPQINEVELLRQLADEISYDCKADTTPLDSLTASNHQVTTEDSSYGKFVKSIDNVEQGGGKYWLYQINGTDATQSASVYVCQDGDKIIWQLR